MIPFDLLLQHSLYYGAALSILMSAVIFMTLYFCPQIWVDDAPADIRRAVGPMSSSGRRIKRLVGIPTLFGVAALLVYSIVQLIGLGNGSVAFSDVALSVFLIVQVFNLVDLIIIDWLFVVFIRPSFLVVPGTEMLQGYQAYAFHFRGFLKGVAGSLVASVVIAGVTMALLTLF